MKKLTIAVIDAVRDQLLKELQTLGSVHVDSLEVEIDDQEITKESWNDDLEAIEVEYSTLEDHRKDIAIALQKITEVCKILPPSFEITSSDVMSKVETKYNLIDLTTQIRSLDKQTKESETLITALSLELSQVKKWASVVNDMSPIHGTSAVLRGVVGFLPELNYLNLCNSIANVTDLAEVLTVWEKDKETYCYVVASPEVWDDVSTVLKNVSFTSLQITRREGMVTDIISSLEQEILSAEQLHKESISGWEHLSHHIDDLALLHDVLEIKIQQIKASSLVVATEKVNFFRAWVPEDYMPKVEAILSIHHKAIDVTIEDPTEEEYTTVPVLLKHNALTRPFGVLTSMYGTPMYGHTVDPTPHLTFFYFIFYGICLGDAIYGTVLALFSLWMMLKNRANQGMADFFALLAWSGLSAIIAGVIFGSYAGDLFTKYIPIPALTDLRFRFSDGASFFDKPLFVLFLSLLIGAIQLWYGYWIKFFVSLKNNGIVAFFNEMPWIILLGGFFAWASLTWIGGMAGLTLLSEESQSYCFLAMKIGAGLVILNNVRKALKKGVGAVLVAPLAGAWELYGISGYLSNLLSYARLLALGLSTGIIANVFNQLGFGMIDSLSAITPILGIFGVVMLIFLHLFNLALGGFGAFVHALRLQFVEFFGQFIEGGGKEFSPLICKGTHYTIK